MWFRPYEDPAGIILLQYLGQKYLLFIIMKDRCLYSGAYSIMNYMHFSSHVCCFHEYQPIWGKVDCSRQSIIPLTLNIVSVMKGREVVGHVAPCS